MFAKSSFYSNSLYVRQSTKSSICALQLKIWSKRSNRRHLKRLRAPLKRGGCYYFLLLQTSRRKCALNVGVQSHGPRWQLGTILGTFELSHAPTEHAPASTACSAACEPTREPNANDASSIQQKNLTWKKLATRNVFGRTKT